MLRSEHLSSFLFCKIAHRNQNISLEKELSSASTCNLVWVYMTKLMQLNNRSKHGTANLERKLNKANSVMKIDINFIFIPYPISFKKVHNLFVLHLRMVDLVNYL